MRSLAPTQAARLQPAGGRLHGQRARQLGRRDRAGGAGLRPDRQPARDRRAVPGHAVRARASSARAGRAGRAGRHASGCCRCCTSARRPPSSRSPPPRTTSRSALVVALAAVDGTLAIARPRLHARLRRGGADALTGSCARATRSSTSASRSPAPSGPRSPASRSPRSASQTALLLDAASFVLVAAMLAAATSLPQVKAQPERVVGTPARGLRVRARPAGAAPADDDAGGRVRVLQRSCCRSRSCTRRRRSTPATPATARCCPPGASGMVLGSLVFLAGAAGPDGDAAVLRARSLIAISYLGMAVAGTLRGGVRGRRRSAAPATACSGWR